MNNRYYNDVHQHTEDERQHIDQCSLFQHPCMQLAPTLALDTGCDAMVKGGVRRSVRLKNVKRSDGAGNDRDNADTFKTDSTKKYQCAIASHLSLNNECAKAYCNDCFSVLSRARSRCHIENLESGSCSGYIKYVCVRYIFVTFSYVHVIPVVIASPCWYVDCIDAAFSAIFCYNFIIM